MAMEWNNDEPLERGIGERSTEYNAFRDYFAMGGARSITKLHAAYNADQPEKSDEIARLLATDDKAIIAAIDRWQARGETPPTRRKATLGKWSGVNAWQARIERQQEIEAAIEDAERKRRIEEAKNYIIDKGIEHGQLFVERVEQFLSAHVAPNETVRVAKRDEDGNPTLEAVELLPLEEYQAALKFRLDADVLLRRAVGLPDKYTQTRLADHEGGPLEMPHITYEEAQPPPGYAPPDDDGALDTDADDAPTTE